MYNEGVCTIQHNNSSRGTADKLQSLPIPSLRAWPNGTEDGIYIHCHVHHVHVYTCMHIHVCTCTFLHAHILYYPRLNVYVTCCMMHLNTAHAYCSY